MPTCYCAVHSVQYALCSMQYTVCSMQYALYLIIVSNPLIHLCLVIAVVYQYSLTLGDALIAIRLFLSNVMDVLVFIFTITSCWIGLHWHILDCIHVHCITWWMVRCITLNLHRRHLLIGLDCLHFFYFSSLCIFKPFASHWICIADIYWLHCITLNLHGRHLLIGLSPNSPQLFTTVHHLPIGCSDDKRKFQLLVFHIVFWHVLQTHTDMYCLYYKHIMITQFTTCQ